MSGTTLLSSDAGVFDHSLGSQSGALPAGTTKARGSTAACSAYFERSSPTYSPRSIVEVRSGHGRPVLCETDVVSGRQSRIVPHVAGTGSLSVRNSVSGPLGQLSCAHVFAEVEFARRRLWQEEQATRGQWQSGFAGSACGGAFCARIAGMSAAWGAAGLANATLASRVQDRATHA